MWFCLCGDKEESAVTCENMITYMPFSIIYSALVCVIILKIWAGLIDFLCIINLSLPAVFPLIMSAGLLLCTWSRPRTFKTSQISSIRCFTRRSVQFLHLSLDSVQLHAEKLKQGHWKEDLIICLTHSIVSSANNWLITSPWFCSPPTAEGNIWLISC